jgi:hypothetical protein
MVQIQAQTGPQILADGSVAMAMRAERSGGLVVQDAHGRLAEAAQRGNLFSAHAIVTAMVINSTAAGTGGPLIWNGSSNKVVSVLAVGAVITTASAVAGTVSVGTGTGQVLAPTTTTAIDSTGNCYTGGPSSQATAYRIGTVTNVVSRQIPFIQISTATTALPDTTINWMWLDGAVLAPPTTYVTLTASATLTSAVINSFIIWEELPL